MKGRVKLLIPKLYYAVTPVFILLDYLCGINVRAVVLDSKPVYKVLYYGFCILCGIAIYLVPRYTAVVALLESTIIFLMTVLSVFIPYVQSIFLMDDILNADIQYISIATPSYIVNLVLAGGMAALTFKQSVNTLGISGNWPMKDIKKDPNNKRPMYC